MLILGLRLCYLLVQYVAGNAGVQRFHIESAAFLLVILGVAFRLSRHVSDETATPGPSLRSPLFLLILIVLAFGIYWPALSIGFLSDDFLLIDRASTWSVGAVNLELFRPLPLSIWALILQIGAGATTIHALNIALHGTNAWLTTRLAAEWVHDRWAARGAGLLMLVAPLAPEAVAWSAGVFDVMATTLVLAVVLIGRQYAGDPSFAKRASFLSVALLALLAKETAAVVPLLVLLDAWVRKQFPRKLLQDTALLFAIVGVIGIVRLTARFGMTAPPIAVRSIRHALFRSFGGLAFPWHSDVLAAWPYLPLLVALVIAAIVTAFFLRAGDKTRTTVALACSAWILVAMLPVFHVFFISYDLQSSRYAYLSSVGWSVLVVTLISDFRTERLWPRWFAPALMITLVISYAFGVRMHLRPWIDAGQLRDTVEQQALHNGRIRTCEEITVARLPDTIRGAYVFRVGAAEELGRVLGVKTTVGNASGPCSFIWDESTAEFK